MKKSLACLAVLLSCGICFVEQSADGCNCQSSSAEQNSQEQNKVVKIVRNSPQINKSIKSTQQQPPDAEQLKKELQELEEFLEKSEEENNKEIENYE